MACAVHSSRALTKRERTLSHRGSAANGEAGFTLVELMVVVVILAVLAVVAIPAVTRGHLGVAVSEVRPPAGSGPPASEGRSDFVAGAAGGAY